MTFSQAAKDFKVHIFEKLFFEYLSESRVREFLIRTIRKRLFLQGLTKNGGKIGTNKGQPYYSRRTQFLKKSGITIRDGKIINTGLRPSDRVTLYGEGHLYASFKSFVKSKMLYVVGNFDDPKYKNGIYLNFTDNFKSKAEFESFVMSLTDEEIHKYIYADFLKYLMKK